MTPPAAVRSVQSQRKIWTVMLRSWETGKRRGVWRFDDRRLHERLSSFPFFFFFFTDCLWAGAAHATLLRRVLSPLRQNPVCLSDNLICPTQPGLKRAMVVLLLLVYFGKWKSEKLQALGRGCRWRSLKKKQKHARWRLLLIKELCASVYHASVLRNDFTDKPNTLIKPLLIWQYVLEMFPVA